MVRLSRRRCLHHCASSRFRRRPQQIRALQIYNDGFAVALVVSVSGCFYNIHHACSEFGDAVSFIPAYVKRILPVGVLLLAPVAVFLSAAAALSVKFKDNAVASFSGLIFLLFLPALGNYYQTQALHRGGELPWSYVVWSFAAALPFVVAFLLMGVFFMRSKDVG